MNRIQSLHEDEVTSPGLSVAVVIPCHGNRGDLERCLEALALADPQPDDVVIVGDGLDEAALEPARRHGFRAISTPQRRGPAAARNLGVTTVDSDLILFIDSDVLVRPDIIERVVAVFVDHPEVAASFGSYDAQPTAPGLASRYKNLQHHWTHQRGSTEASTFWTGCGAIKTAVFRQIGGFDPSLRWLEDVDLGYRLHAQDLKIRLDRDVQVTHLKRWSVGRLFLSDVLHRALPWTKLSCRYRALPKDLNTDLSGRLSGGLGLVVAASLVAMLVSPWFGIAAASAWLGIAWLNRDFYRFLARCGGVPLLGVGMVLHCCYFVYGTAAFVAGSCWWRTLGAQRPTQRPPMTKHRVGGDENQADGTENADSRASRPSAESRSA